MHPAGGKGEEDGAQENQGMDPGKEKVCCQLMPATVMAARMEDVTGERDPQDPSNPWRGPLNRCNLEETQKAVLRLIRAGKHLTLICLSEFLNSKHQLQSKKKEN